MEYLDDKINNSKFVISLIMNSKDVYANHMKDFLDKKLNPDDFDIHGSQLDIYKKRTFNKYIALVNQLETISVIPNYFDCEDCITAMIKQGINEIDYYKYHFETFLIRITSILDFCSKLGNQVYALDIEERDCNWVKFTNKLGNELASQIVIKLKDNLKNITKTRNIIIHEGNHQTDEIKSIDDKIFNLDMIEIEDILQEWFDKQKNEKVVEIKEKMIDTIVMVIDLSFEFIESLKDTFEEKIK